jgi:hypothetical protein
MLLPLPTPASATAKAAVVVSVGPSLRELARGRRTAAAQLGPDASFPVYLLPRRYGEQSHVHAHVDRSYASSIPMRRTCEGHNMFSRACRNGPRPLRRPLHFPFPCDISPHATTLVHTITILLTLANPRINHSLCPGSIRVESGSDRNKGDERGEREMDKVRNWLR